MSIAAERLHRITVDTYEAMGAAGLLPERGVELLDGLVVDMSPKGVRHGYALRTIVRAFNVQSGDRFAVYPEALSLRLGPSTMPEPDVALVRPTGNFARELPLPADVALIVEIADSSLAYDLGVKRDLYARADIPEYWVVDLVDDLIHVFASPAGGVYADRSGVHAGAMLSPHEYPGVVIDVREILGLEP